MGASLDIIEENSFRATEAGFEIKVRLNWYRSLPLSSIVDAKLALDGKAISTEQIKFVYDNKEYKIDELPDQVDTYWFVQDSAVLRAEVKDKINPGEKHEITTVITLKKPYIPVGPGKFLTIPTNYKTVQIAV